MIYASKLCFGGEGRSVALPAFGVLCRVVAEFDKSLFGHVFKTKAFKGGGFSGKVKGLRQGRIAS